MISTYHLSCHQILDPCSIMSQKTILKLDSIRAKEELPHYLQYIPATIEYNGKEEIQTFFSNFIKPSDEKRCLEASLRGRPLEGEVLTLPEGYECVVLQAGQGDGVGGVKDNKILHGIKKVDRFTF